MKKHQDSSRFRLLLLAGVAFCLCGASSQAATVNWIQTSGTNDYGVGTNWSGSSVPGTSDTASFPAAASGDQTITVSSQPTKPAYMEIGTTSGTLTFEGTGAANVDLEATPYELLIGADAAGGSHVVVKKSGSGDFTLRGRAGLVVGGAGSSNNSLTVTGTGAFAGSGGGILILGHSAGSSNNTVDILAGARMDTRGGTVGRTGGADNNVVTVSGTGSNWTAVPVGGTIIDIGPDNSSSGNKIVVSDGGLLQAAMELNVSNGTLQLDGGTVDLTYNSTSNDLLLSAAGRVEGQGLIKANAVSSSGAGAVVEVGTGGFGILDAEFTGTGWNNLNVKIEMSLGDLTGTPVAGTDYDFLDIVGDFTFGGGLEIDLASVALPGGAFDILLVGWTGAVGSSGDLNVSFINGSDLGYYYAGDGLHLVPEPSAAALLALGLLGMALGRSRRKG